MLFLARLLCLFLVVSTALSADEELKSTGVNINAPFSPPEPQGDYFFYEPFHSPEDLGDRWVVSKAMKDGVDETIAKYDGTWSVEQPENQSLTDDYALIVKDSAKHHAVSVKLDKTYVFMDKPFVLQFDLKFQEGQECGGGYVKVLSADKSRDLSQFNDQTPYTIMFGPDKCGQTSKLHFIFRHKNPINGEYEEKAAKIESEEITKNINDKKTHLYTLLLKPNNDFEVLIDKKLIHSGSLLTDVNPPVNPPKEIRDPNAKKPTDWDDRKEIPDPSDVKPETWVDEKFITDNDATRPDDWDDEVDGDWEAPKVDNPAYKGEWKPNMIPNPEYSGVWKHPMIANPNYFEDKSPFRMTPVDALGIELWTMSKGIAFDNFIITDHKFVADKLADDTWTLKLQKEKDPFFSKDSYVSEMIQAASERPWLAVALGFGVFVPLIAVFYYCCYSSTEEKALNEEQFLDDADTTAVGDDLYEEAAQAEDEPNAMSDEASAAEEDEEEETAPEEPVESGDSAAEKKPETRARRRRREDY